MTIEEELKKIKEQYSENFMHLCRSMFPTILERPGLLYEVLDKNFAPNPFLYDDVAADGYDEETFKNYIFSKIDVEKGYQIITDKTPAELLKEAGYTLYECHTKEDIDKFRKYYAPGEELCTFGSNRLERCHVFFAVKDNVDEIKRVDFKEPKREDEYGTSVISIQFSKDSSNTLSIKNRYNHTVNNPDATFGNNLENIITGLTDAFNREYNLKTTSETQVFDFPYYVKANDGKYYRFNCEMNNIYYCPNNIIIDNFEVKRFEKEKYIVMDYFILDMQKESRGITLYDSGLKDCMPDTIGKIEKIEKTIDKSLKTVTLKINDTITIALDKYNSIYCYMNPDIEVIGDNFLRYANLVYFELPKVREIGDSFLSATAKIDTVENLPELEKIGDYFMFNSRVKYCDLPKVREIGYQFKCGIMELNLPNLERVGACFGHADSYLNEISFPKLKYIGNFFYSKCNPKDGYVKVDLPSAEFVGEDFMAHAPVNSLNMPNLKDIRQGFLFWNTTLKEINLPNVQKISHGFLTHSNEIEKVLLPKVEDIRDDFLKYCIKSLKEIDLTSLRRIGNNCLMHFDSLTELSLPNLEEAGVNFLQNNFSLQSINFPKLKKLDLTHTLMFNHNIKYVNGKMIDNAKLNNILYAIMVNNHKNDLFDDYIHKNK